MNQIRIFILACLVTGITACNNSADKPASEKDSPTINSDTAGDSAKSDTAGKPGMAMRDATVNIPIFKMTRANFVDLNGKNPKKLLFTLEVLDLNKPASGINLLVFSAKSHKDYARGDSPLTITEKKGEQSLSSHLIIGNNEVPFHPFKKGNELVEFEYVLFKPRIMPKGAGDVFPHLVFDIVAYDKDNKPIPLKLNKDTDLTNTNPSPPATPSPED